jgi:integrase
VSVEDFFRPDMFADWCHWLRSTPDNRGNLRRGSTVNGRIGMARTLWRWAADRGLTANACPLKFKRATVSKDPPTAWTLPEMAAILAHVGYAPRIRGWSPQHWTALLSIYWEVGPRINALLACRLDDLNRGHLHLTAEHDKEQSGSKHKLSDETLLALQAIERHPEDRRLLPWPRSIDTLRRHFRVILKAAGLASTRRDLFHKLRRTHATHLWVATGSAERAQRSLNHSKVATTIQNYLDPTHLEDVPAADVLPRLPR